MTGVRISSALEEHDVRDAVQSLADVADALDGASVLRTQADGRVRRGQPTPPERISRFWYVRGSSTVVLDHEANNRHVLLLEDAIGTRRISIGGVLPTGLSRADCMDARPLAAAVDALHSALADAPVSTDPTRIVPLCEAIADARPRGISRHVSLRAPTPFSHASLSGTDDHGFKAVRDSAMARAFILAELGRPVIVEGEASRPMSWIVRRMTATASSNDPDPVTRMRLHADAARAGGPLYEIVKGSRFERSLSKGM